MGKFYTDSTNGKVFRNNIQIDIGKLSVYSEIDVARYNYSENDLIEITEKEYNAVIGGNDLEQWIVDRVEEEYVVVEYMENFYDIPINLLPGVVEGSIIDIEIKDGEERRKTLENKLTQLFNKGVK